MNMKCSVFFKNTGKLAVGTRLRMLTDKITEDASVIYRLYGVDIKPKWFPVIFVLLHGEAKTITSIAKEIGHSHPSVSNIIKEMAAKGLVKETKDKSDGRRNVVLLSPKGKDMSALLMGECAEDVAHAIEKISQQSRNDLWRALEEWEELLADKSLLQRVKEEKWARERNEVEIVTYEPCYQPIFRALNEEWITAHWKMEESDYKALDHPQEYILDKGGYIFVALYKNEPVGVCALNKLEDSPYDYELAKLAVSPKAQGRGIGLLLGEAVLNKAIEAGGQKVFLESNTLLKPAIHLYRKLGFRELAEYHPSYERGNIQMEFIAG